jgi:hypothetical protein
MLATSVLITSPAGKKGHYQLKSAREIVEEGRTSSSNNSHEQFFQKILGVSMNSSGAKDETGEMVATARARSHFTIDSYHIDEI